MARRVGFGDGSPEGPGGWPWAALLALTALVGAAAIVLDPSLLDRLLDWAPGVGGRGAVSWLLAIPVVAGALWALRRLFVVVFSSRRQSQGGDAPPARGRGAPSAKPTAAPRRRIGRRGRNWEEDDEPPTASQPTEAGGAISWFAIVFLIVWLCGWTVGIIFAISMFIEETNSQGFGPHWFILIWIGFALVGWVVAFGMLIGMLRGAISRR